VSVCLFSLLYEHTYRVDIQCSMFIYSFLIYILSACNGVVLATEKKHKSVLFDENSIHKVDMVTKNIGMTYSGIGPDYRSVF